MKVFTASKNIVLQKSYNWMIIFSALKNWKCVFTGGETEDRLSSKDTLPTHEHTGFDRAENWWAVTSEIVLQESTI